MKHYDYLGLGISARAVVATLCLTPTLATVAAAPPGPTPQIPDGGAAPGAYPNTSVSGANLIVRGGPEYDDNVEIVGFEGNGPIPWVANRYNRGDIALRFAPGNPEAAIEQSLNRGFTQLAEGGAEFPFNQAWRPSSRRGVVIATARDNGPVDWNDGQGPFYPTVAISTVSSGPGYDMVSGAWGNGDLDINIGRAGTHDGGPEANASFSVAWFPYDQGWLGGDAAGPLVGDFFLPDGTARWKNEDSHAAGLSAGVVRWLEYPEFSFSWGGLAIVRLPGVNSLEDGMLFATSSDGSSDVNIVGVAPRDEGDGWLVTIREDSAVDAETLAAADQSEFQFVYIPFDAERLIGGHITGATGAKRKAVGDFTVTRAGAGVYEITIPGKTGDSGALILQPAAFEPGTTEPLATRAFMSYEFADGKFVAQSRVLTSDTTAELRDVDFYVAWIDFEAPLAPPTGPRMRSQGPVAVSPQDARVQEVGIAAHTTQPEVLVTTIDADSFLGLPDPITGEFGFSTVIGRFYNAETLQPTSEPFAIVGNSTGTFSRHDVAFNPVSGQYVVVANARGYGPLARATPLIALVNSATVVGEEGQYVAKSFAYRADADADFDDVAVSVSTQTGTFMLAAEYKFPDEGEGAVGALFDKDGQLLTQGEGRLDLLQSVGDEDDPDVVYLPGIGAFLYLANTDNSNGSTGTLANRVAGAIVDAAPNSEGNLVTRVEQPLADGLPAGVAEGHPAAIENPFNGEIIVAFDAGNDTASGTLSYVKVGPAPGYEFTAARPEVKYLDGADGRPFNHQHPQLAVNPERGVIVVGFNATGSNAGFADGYAFILLGPDGLPLPSQLKAPYFLADAPGGLGTSANFHDITYSAATGRFLAAYTTTNPTTTYLAALEVTSDHLSSGGGEDVELAVESSGGNVVISWPAAATGYVLQSSATLGAGASWSAVSGAPTQADGRNTVTVTPDGTTQFYRLARP